MSPKSPRSPYDIYWQLSEFGDRMLQPAAASATPVHRLRARTPAPTARPSAARRPDPVRRSVA